MIMTDAAISKWKILIKDLDLNESETYLRLAIKGGGCSGFMYSYDFVSETEERDKIFDFGAVKICVGVKSYLFLIGMEIDYEEDLLKSGIVFNAPQAQTTCGCGESVSF